MKRTNVYDALVMQLLSFMGGSKTDDMFRPVGTRTQGGWKKAARRADFGGAEWRRSGGRDGGALDQGGVQAMSRRSDVALAVGGLEDGGISSRDQPNSRLQTGDVPAAVDSDGNGARPMHLRKAKK